MTQLATQSPTRVSVAEPLDPPDDLSPEELLRLEQEHGLEYFDGQFWEQPQVSWESNRIAARIIGLLFNSMSDPAEAEIANSELVFQCHPTIKRWGRKPDVSLFRKDRLVGIGDPGTMPIPPDLAVEVLSRHDKVKDVLHKLDQYREAGFPLVWMVDADTRIVDVCRGDGSVTRLHADDELTVGDALPNFRHRVADLFV